jgi:NTP pyrophosphatase (non-canonical NTP hydrolase)
MSLQPTLLPEHIAQAAHILTQACYGAAQNAGWWIDTETGEDVRTWPAKFFKLWCGTKMALMAGEIVGEALEGVRKGGMDDKLPHRSSEEVELADAVIRICDYAGGRGLDLGAAIAEKLAYNAQRADHKIENRIAEGGKTF